MSSLVQSVVGVMVGAVVTLASSALAAEPMVPVQADIVTASTKGGPAKLPAGTAPQLVKMQETLSAKVLYSQLAVVESKRVEVVKQPATMIVLPNKKIAELRLESLVEGVATLRVKVPPTDATYTLAKDKALYLQAGVLGQTDLWLVLSQPK